MTSCVLIVTARLDPHADVVIDRIEARGGEVFRLNSEDLMTTMAASIAIDQSGLSATLRNSCGLAVDVPKGIRAAYYRKPLRRRIRSRTPLKNS